MRSLATVLATLVVVLYLIDITDASVIVRGTDKVEGWCCSADCDLCVDGPIHCHHGDILTCFDLTGVGSSPTLSMFFSLQENIVS